MDSESFTGTVSYPAKGREPSSHPRQLGVLIGLFALLYGVGQAAVALSIGGPEGLLPASLFLLVLLAAGLFFAGVFEPRKDVQQLYVAVALMPVLTIARLSFYAGILTAYDPLFVYLLLGVTLIGFRQAWRGPPLVTVERPKRLILALPLVAILTFGFVDLALYLPRGPSVPVSGPIWFGAFVAGPVAFLDELWFRGILQTRIARLTSPGVAFLVTAALFTAYGAPFGPPGILPFRLALGLMLGSIAIREDRLLLALGSRTAIAIAFVVLSPGLLGTSLVV